MKYIKFIAILCAIGFVELFIMMVVLPMAGFHADLRESLLDTAILCAVVSPLIYMLIKAETDVSKLNHLLQMESLVRRELFRAADRESLFGSACRIAVEDGKFVMAWVGLADGGFISPVASCGKVDGYLDGFTIPVGDVPEGRGPTGAAFRKGVPVISNDIKNDDAMLPWRKGALERGYRSSGSFPLFMRGEPAGTLNVYSEMPNYFSSREVGMLEGLAAEISHALGLMEHEYRRMEAEKELEDNTRKYMELVERLPQAVFEIDLDGKIQFVNQFALSLFGYTRDEFTGSIESIKILIPEDVERIYTDILRVMEGADLGGVEYTAIKKDGSTFPLLVYTNPIERNGRPVGIRGVAIDITERKLAEKERDITIEFLQLVNRSSSIDEIIHEAAAFFQEQSGCTAVGIRLRKGEDFPYYEASGFPENFIRMENSLCLRDKAGDIIRDATGYPIMECMCGNVICGRFDPSKPFFTEHGSFWTNSTTELLTTTTESDRQARTRNRCNGEGYESVALLPLRVGQDRMGLLQLNDKSKGRFTLRDITVWERLANYLAVALAKFQAEDALSESELKYRSLFENMASGFAYCKMLFDDAGRPSDFIYLDVNSAFGSLTGLYDVVGKKVTEVIPGIKEMNPEVFEIYGRVSMTGQPERFEIEFKPLNAWLSVSAYSPAKGYFVAIFDNITDRKLAEENIRESETRLKEAQSIGKFGYWLAYPETGKVLWSDELYNLYGRDPSLGPSSLDESMEYFPGQREFITGSMKKAEETGETVQYDLKVTLPGGKTGYHAVTVNASKGPDGKLEYYHGTVQDVTDRKLAEEKIKRDMDHLAGLRLIDIAISGSHDLRVTLNVLLEQTMKQLHVDAACMLMLNPYSQMLEYEMGYGFTGDSISLANVRLGEGFAGRAALSRRTLIIPEITVVHDGTTPWRLIEEEGFKAYVGVPLVAKGHIKGVLEIFNRSPLRQDKEWLNFAEALAGQAAIALDNAELFDRLEHSNNELLLAYDTTIEGWSRALDYRDKETEGHSLRVTDMAVRLCKTVGMDEEELVHVRRGALLHDIGKLGVPDSILLKPGKLTEDEFAVIKAHPDIAYKLLSPIPFLRIALDVPYCHHEKWDGSGYPRGLKGEEIPLSARIFAIIDVWDALRSDRPYRKAWPEDKTREFMRSESGTHFDAKLLDIFLSMDWHEG